MLQTGLGKSAVHPAGQVTFHCHLPNAQGPGKFVCQLHKISQLRVAQGKQNLRAAKRAS